MSQDKNKKKELKFIAIGENSCGKSALAIRYVQKTFHPTNFLEQYSTTVKKAEQDIKISVWDYCSNGWMSRVRHVYYRDSDAVVLVYDITKRESFLYVQKWLDDYLEKGGNKYARMALTGTKSDLKEERQVSKEEGQQLANELGILFFETSSKLDENVNELYEALLDITINTQKI